MKVKEETIPVNEEIIKALEAFGLSSDFMENESKEDKDNFFEKAINSSTPNKKSSIIRKGINQDLTPESDPKEILLKSLGFDDETINGFSQVGAILKGFGEMQDLVTKQNDLIKGLTTKMETVVGQNTTLQERLSKVENTPLPRKSISNNYIEKGFAGEGMENPNNGQTVLSLSKNRKEILNVLEAKAELDKMEKGMEGNPLYVNGLLQYESSGFMPKDVISELNKESIVIIN